MRPTSAEIHLESLLENIQTLKNLHVNSRNQQRDFFCPMIKANAYGHGEIEIAKFIERKKLASHLGVALVEEGVQLRKNGVQTPTLVFGYFDKESIEECLQRHLTPVISSFEFLNLLPKNQKIKIHLKFDTGMSRMGFRYEDTAKLSDYLAQNKNLYIEGICTHFSQSSDSFSTEGTTHHQMQIYTKIEKEFKKFYEVSHCLNSDALLNAFQGTESYHQDTHYLGARPGLAIYGYPSISGLGKKTNLKPVMTLKTVIAQVHKIKKGETVSYGGTWKALRDSLIATVAIGYGDGYPRNLSNQSWMLYRGQRVPLVGRVCMDYCMLDLTEYENQNPHAGEEVIVWGPQLGADELAQKMSTISYELLTRVSSRVPRFFLEKSHAE